jgi:N-acetylglucosamine-6-phosphate deacetylase
MVNTIISGPQIYTDEGILQNTVLSIEDSIIASFTMDPSIKKENVLSFPGSYHLVPGFIDLHIHGANHCDVMDATQEALTVLSQTLATEGTTSYLATTMTASVCDIEKTLRAVRDYFHTQRSILGATVLGVHLEGPFISPKKIGAQRADYLLTPDIEIFSKWQKEFGHVIKLVTLAPELPHSLAFIHYLREQHIVASIGHTDATYLQTLEAIQAGCGYVTHLFNAMRGIQQREPGVVTAALLSEKVKTEMIVDGTHLHPAIVKLALRLKGIDNVVLVTDAMRAKCLGDGVYDLGGQAVHVTSGIAKLSDGTLAGSVLRMPEAIRHMIAFTDCSLYDAITMASKNPAKVLNIFDRKGSIAIGKDADLVVLDDDLQVVMTMVGGKIVYQQGY